MAKFKKEVLDIMKGDPDLFAAIAKEMEVKPTSLPMIIERNGHNLNQYSVVALVATHLNRNPDELIEDEKAVA